MPEQVMVRSPSEAENVCVACKHFTEMDGGFYCRFFDAFLSEETLCLPCDFAENIEQA